ncbi:hypothetical protein K1719_036806 [Acacia pycnantha]|nr:hypothetical protein K1719_036806 [Acacia pycnantha]
MFGSTNPFGQSSASPFGSQSVFGQTNASSSNPFAPKPFGSTTPFGLQTSSSLFGGTSTGVFGAPQSSSPFCSTNTFGAASSPAFGSSVPAFGSSSTSAFGNTSPSLAGSSVFGQKPAFGGFGSTTQASPFGSAAQPSQPQPAFGSSIFGSSTPFGASSRSTFGSTSTPAFGTSSTPAFGSTSTPFGATSMPAFGSTSSPTFGSTGSAFGASSPVFGAGGGFGQSSTPLFGSSTTSAFRTSTTPAFGVPSAPAFGASSTPSFTCGSTQTFGQSASAFGSSPFGSTSSPFGAQSSPFGSQTTSSAFGSTGVGQSGFGGQQGGSRVAKYAPTAEAYGGTSGQTTKLESISAKPIYNVKSHKELRWEDYQIGNNGSQTTSSAFECTGNGKSSFGGQQGGSRVAKYAPTAEADGGTSEQTATLESISAMPIYKHKRHEELRWEDYQIGDKGGPLNSTQSTGMGGFSSTTTQTNTFPPSSAFGQSAANPFSTSTPSNPFASKSSAFSTGFGTSSVPAFSSSAFGTLTTATTPVFGSSVSTFGVNSPPLFSYPALGTASPFGSCFNFGNTQSSNIFSSPAPTIAQLASALGQSTSLFGQGTSAFSQSSLFNSTCSGLGGNIFSSRASLTSNNLEGFDQKLSPLSTPFQTGQAAQTTGTFGIGNFGQMQTGLMPRALQLYKQHPFQIHLEHFLLCLRCRLVELELLHQFNIGTFLSERF